MLRAAVAPVIEFMGRDRVANRNRTLRLAALERPITIDFDRWGIPHIRAATRHDLFFGQGFVHAQDRMWQMEVNRLVAKGEMASILGKSALPLDRMSRTLGFRRNTASTWQRLPKPMQQDFEAYAAGINGYLSTVEKLPLEFRLLRYRPKSWVPQDSVAFGLLQGWGLSTGWAHALSRSTLIAALGETLFAEIDPAYPGGNPVTLPDPLSPDLIKRLNASKTVVREAAETMLGRQILPPNGGIDGTGIGSNAWVIGANRSASGQPILANDTHLVVNSPGIWYYNHLLLEPDQEGERRQAEDTTPARFHATGVVIPGSPGVVIGHNESIAWGITVAYTDTQDLYLERIHPKKAHLVEYNGEWESVETIAEEIEVKGEPLHLETVRTTRHGPILTQFLPEASLDAVEGQDQRYRYELALASVALQPGGFAFQGLLQIAEAADWTDFKAAVDRVDFPSLNIVYADTAGNIGYGLTGKIPIRNVGDGRTIVPGWTATYDWTGTIPKDEMPFELNPARGYIVTCNHKIGSADYPHHLGHCWMNGYRAGRLEMLMAEKETISVTDCQAWQIDVYSIPGMQLADLLRDFETDDADAAISLEMLKKWDGFLTVDSQGGAVYKILLRQLAENLLSPALQTPEIDRLLGKGDHPLFSTNSELYGYWPSIIIRLLSEEGGGNAWIPGGVGRKALLVQALKGTTVKCRSYFGDNQTDWHWGKLHKISFLHGFDANPLFGPIFNLGPYPLAGDTDTVCQTAAFPIGAGTEQFAANGFAPAFRQVVDLGALSYGVAMTVPGQSGQLKDPHYVDLIDPWLKGEYYPQLWTWPAVEKASRGRLTINPSK